MKRNVIAIACAAVVAAAIAIPLGMGHAPAPEAAIQPAAETAPVSETSSTPATSEGAEPSSDSQSEQQDDASQSHEQSYEQGVVLVGLQDGATADDLNARLAELDYIATKRVSEDDLVFGYAELELAGNISVKDAESRIASENSDIIAAAQPNYIYHALGDVEQPAPSSLVASVIAEATTVNDAYASRQWALDAVNAYDAWATPTVDDSTIDDSITVAVFDTGVKTNHGDLADRIADFYNVKYSRVIKKSGTDDNGHGTHIAGIIAATANNSIGIAGVSHNAAKILSIKVLDENATGTAVDLARGLDQVVTCIEAGQPIKVANLSLGMVQSPEEIEKSDLVLEALSKLHDKGCLVVYAAGNDAIENDGAYLNFPVDYDTNPGAIGVISVNDKSGTTGYQRSSFSNYNMSNQRTKDLSAPGNYILSTSIKGMNDGLSPGQSAIKYYDSTYEYGYMSGTSMAAPYISGIAALVFAHNPELSPAAVRNILCNTAQDINSAGWDAQTGHGLVDAAAAVAAAKAGSNTDAPLTSAKITLSQSSYTYSGVECRPHATVELDGAKLTETQDYTIDYSNNTNAGTATVTITGAGSYTGTAKATFTIAPKKVTPTVTLSAASRVYSGSAWKPAITVKVGSTTIPSSSYVISGIDSCKAIGKYTAAVTLKSNYTGTASASFTIVPKGTKISKLKAGKKSFTVKWKKQTTQTSGYQVQCSLKKNFSSKCSTFTISGNKITSAKASQLKAKKTYYVRVRTFKKVSGVKYYSAWSGKKSVKTKA